MAARFCALQYRRLTEVETRTKVFEKRMARFACCDAACCKRPAPRENTN
ncbi:Uncharacterised protein [Bordetella pertussis]|nr:Uncharacterised protein [Bordetella pertussis]